MSFFYSLPPRWLRQAAQSCRRASQPQEASPPGDSPRGCWHLTFKRAPRAWEGGGWERIFRRNLRWGHRGQSAPTWVPGWYPAPVPAASQHPPSSLAFSVPALQPHNVHQWPGNSAPSCLIRIIVLVSGPPPPVRPTDQLQPPVPGETGCSTHPPLLPRFSAPSPGSGQPPGHHPRPCLRVSFWGRPQMRHMSGSTSGADLRGENRSHYRLQIWGAEASGF